jgi:hypothetical protein
MDQNKLRKLAGLPLLKEWKEVVDAPTNAKPAKKDKEEKDDAKKDDADLDIEKGEDGGDAEGKGKDKEKDDKDDLPEIITKIAQSVCKKFGIGDPDGGESDDLTAMEDFLKKVYDAGVADGAAKGDDLKEDAQNIASVVSVHKAYTQKVNAIKAALEKTHSVDGAPLETSQSDDYVQIHLPNKPYNTVGAVQQTLKSFEGNGYEAGNVK